MNIPSDLLYTNDHEWVKVEDGLATIGITDWAQSELGDIVYLELAAVGDSVEQGKPFGTIEAVKAVSDIYAAVSGTVEAVNDALIETPELANQDPYGKGWMLKVRTSNLKSEIDNLLTPEAYEALLG
ncbi:glycine cleavage system protein GcvH [bacterium]|nr:glycine cleavage system protein GcvH [bacterium]MBU1937071.1 glycine cleavage system protein GcvH [bacterium]